MTVRSPPEGLSFRSATSADAEVVGGIAASAFGSSDTRLSEIRRYLTLEPNYWILAILKGLPVGAVGATDYGSFAYLGMMTVRKEFQRRGIGAALFSHALAWLEKEGISFLRLDATEDGFPIYLRNGFEVVDRAAVYQLPQILRPSGERDLSQGISRLEAPDLRELVSFDTPVFGGNRTHLFQAFLQDFPGRAFAARDESGKMTGFLFAQSRRVGPWVARTPKDAETLLLTALNLPFQGRPLVVVPERNPTAVGLLVRLGFSRGREGLHMQRGSTTVPGERSVIYGQTSFAIG